MKTDKCELYLSARCSVCYWALYDGDWCQNQHCVMHGKPVGENRVILTNDEAQTSMQNAKVRGGERIEIERLIEGVSQETDTPKTDMELLASRGKLTTHLVALCKRMERERNAFEKQYLRFWEQEIAAYSILEKKAAQAQDFELLEMSLRKLFRETGRLKFAILASSRLKIAAMFGWWQEHDVVMAEVEDTLSNVRDERLAE